jgi:DNA-binding NarL/FixJ family response regulator
MPGGGQGESASAEATEAAADATDAASVLVLGMPLAHERALTGLTRAERAVALLLLAGASNVAIAEARGASPRTVANQVAGVFRKLGVGSRTSLIARVGHASDPEGARLMFLGLAAGRLSVVERFERDGRRVLVARAVSQADPRSRSLSRRELQIVARCALGRSNRAIANELVLATSTVATFLSSGLAKLGVASRSDLVSFFHATARDVIDHEP